MTSLLLYYKSKSCRELGIISFSNQFNISSSIWVQLFVFNEIVFIFTLFSLNYLNYVKYLSTVSVSSSLVKLIKHKSSYYVQKSSFVDKR
jgi:hypothetical protein